jgi:predicted nuclease of predicted toxin-antitoxin system
VFLKEKTHIKIYADENVNVAIVEGLKRRGVEAWSAIDNGKCGLSDEEQLKYAFGEKAIFTHDDDFLGMAAESEIEHFGIIYVHQQHLSIGDCIRKLKAIVEAMSPEEMHNRILFL